jgi:hypothetical protein
MPEEVWQVAPKKAGHDMARKVVRYLVRVAVLAVCCALLGGPVFIAWVFFYVAPAMQEEAYAVWETADLVIAYMEQHESTWPSGWGDLRPLADGDGRYVSEHGGHTEMGFRPPLTLDRLQELAHISHQGG